MTLAAYLGRWGCCPTGSGRLCIKPKSVIPWLGGSEEFPRIEANEGGDDTAIANPVPSVPLHDAHTWLHPTFNPQHPDPREA